MIKRERREEEDKKKSTRNLGNDCSVGKRLAKRACQQIWRVLGGKRERVWENLAVWKGDLDGAGLKAAGSSSLELVKQGNAVVNVDRLAGGRGHEAATVDRAVTVVVDQSAQHTQTQIQRHGQNPNRRKKKIMLCL